MKISFTCPLGERQFHNLIMSRYECAIVWHEDLELDLCFGWQTWIHCKTYAIKYKVMDSKWWQRNKETKTSNTVNHKHFQK